MVKISYNFSFFPPSCVLCLCILVCAVAYAYGYVYLYMCLHVYINIYMQIHVYTYPPACRGNRLMSGTFLNYFQL